MLPENYIHSLLIFLTLLSVCAALASFICKYIYYGKHSWWFDKLLRGQTYYRPYLTLGTAFSKSKWLTPWPRHRDGGRGKKDWIQILDMERDTDNALWVYWGRKGVVKVILNHQNWSWDLSFYWILSHKLSKKSRFPVWQKDTSENYKKTQENRCCFRCHGCPI